MLNLKTKFSLPTKAYRSKIPLIHGAHFFDDIVSSFRHNDVVAMFLLCLTVCRFLQVYVLHEPKFFRNRNTLFVTFLDW